MPTTSCRSEVGRPDRTTGVTVMTETNQADPLFYSLVLSLQAAAMQQMGKVMNPLTNSVERNLDAARQSIDLLDMIRRKTDGNLAEDEAKMLEHVLYELRMNFVDESNKPASEGMESQEPPTSPDSDPEPGTETD